MSDRDDWAPIEPSTPAPTATPETQPQTYATTPPPYLNPQQLPKAGDARTGPLPLHPMALGDVLDGAFKLFKANARTILFIVAAITLPIQLATAFALRRQLEFGLLNVITDPTVAEAAAEQQQSAGQLVVTFGSAFVGLLVTPFIAGAISRVVAASYLGREISPWVALRAALRRFPALLAAFFLVHLLELPAFLLCILPGFAVSAMFTLVAPAIAVEEIGPIQAMRRSWRLVRPRFWNVLAISLLAGFIANAIGQVLATAPTLVGLFLGGSFAWLLIAIAGIAGSLVSTPIVTISATLLYFDARIRQEGFDLQVIAQHLDSGRTS